MASHGLSSFLFGRRTRSFLSGGRRVAVKAAVVADIPIAGDLPIFFFFFTRSSPTLPPQSQPLLNGEKPIFETTGGFFLLGAFFGN